jgi:hypothetical protein
MVQEKHSIFVFEWGMTKKERQARRLSHLSGKVGMNVGRGTLQGKGGNEHMLFFGDAVLLHQVIEGRAAQAEFC